MKQDIQFKTSRELKMLFNSNFETWDQANNGGYEELGRRCGLSGAYISQIGKYGRVPGKSALILLALNFDLKDPSLIFKAAGIHDPWPYKKQVHLSKDARENDSFVSVKIDMDGLLTAVQSAISKEVRPRTVKDLLMGRPLRVGYNPFKIWLFESKDRDIHGEFKGFFPEIVRMLGMSLQTKVEERFIEYAEYPSLFQKGELDIFGPIVEAPNLPSGTLFSNPLYRIAMSIVYRLRPVNSLDTVPPPKKPEDLLSDNYKIAVVKNSRAHLLCTTRFKKSDKDLILCRSVEEALDRTIMKGVSQPAHLFMCNAVDALLWEKEYKRDIKALFTTPDTYLDLADTSIAVRADWPELLQIINENLSFLTSTGTLLHSLDHWRPKGMEKIIEGI
ncbi:MAG TPA: transporter substrate-binding domain-containing protein [Oligoflexia bacterium]|nr:transporter substrate-binding domain-containing protein [Oligoflexia bacterium]HMP49576.1 transporter substrate-binding domain-containing protein [Oligoflexia bacterium]